jgi:putative addiction module component (TIGR02574 family)
METQVMTFEELEAAALKLSTKDREKLLQSLILSLDGIDPDQEPDPEILQAAIEEAERRYQDYLEGKVEAIPGEEVFRKYRAALQ